MQIRIRVRIHIRMRIRIQVMTLRFVCLAMLCVSLISSLGLAGNFGPERVEAGEREEGGGGEANGRRREQKLVQFVTEYQAQVSQERCQHRRCRMCSLVVECVVLL